MRLLIIGLLVLLTACNTASTREAPVAAAMPVAPAAVANNTDTTGVAGTVGTAGTRDCPAWRGVVFLERSVTLPPGCVFRGVELRVRHQQNLVLNMNGAHFDAAGNQQLRGIWFMNVNPAKPTAHIVLRNATFSGYLEGIRVHRGISKGEAARVSSGQLPPAQLRATATHDIRIENVRVLDSRGDGVVFHGGVHHVVLTGSVVANNGGVGIYFGDMTSQIEVSNSKIYGNGYRKLDGSARYGRGRRENIAIDASFNNRIVNNVIRDAAEGGIALYKNCSEHAGQAGQLARLDHARGNQIIGNTITGNNGYGIHVAERQDWELSAFKCGDPLYYQRGGLYYRDHAEQNTLRDNRVLGNGDDIVVQDDNNTLINNQTGNIRIGSRIRQAAGEPVRGTVLRGNTGQVHYQFGGS